MSEIQNGKKRFCTNCGTQAAGDEKFCMNSGTELPPVEPAGQQGSYADRTGGPEPGKSGTRQIGFVIRA